jgi:TonB family protein
MTNMQDVVRLADKFIDPRNPRSIDREGQLNVIVLMVACVHAAVMISLFGIAAWEKGLGQGDKYSTVVSFVLEKTVMPQNAQITRHASSQSTSSIPNQRHVVPIVQKKSSAGTQAQAMAANTIESGPEPRPDGPPLHSDKKKVNQEQTFASKQPDQHPKQTKEGTGEVTGTGQGTDSQTLSHENTAKTVFVAASPTTGNGTAPDRSNNSGYETENKSNRSSNVDRQSHGDGAIANLPPGGGARLMGNIGPYRKNLLHRIGQNWHPTDLSGNITLLITLDRDGNLLASEVLESSGSRRLDKQAIVAVKNTEFAPLPEWFKGNHLQFRVELTNVETSNGHI